MRLPMTHFFVNPEILLSLLPTANDFRYAIFDLTVHRNGLARSRKLVISTHLLYSHRIRQVKHRYIAKLGKGASSAEEQFHRLIEQVAVWTPRPSTPLPLILVLMFLRSYCSSRSFSNRES